MHFTRWIPAALALLLSSVSAQEREDKVMERMNWFYEHRSGAIDVAPGSLRLEGLKHWDRKAAVLRRNRAANGERWVSIGPSPTHTVNFNFTNLGAPRTSGRIAALAVDPRNADVVYLGAASGGIWKTVNGGESWVPLTDQMPSLATGAIAIDPQNPDTIYVGTGEQTFSGSSYYGAGFLKSTDGGATWRHIPGQFVGPFPPTFLTGGATVGGLSIHTQDTRILLAGITTNAAATSGIVRSTDGGETWRVVLPGGSGTGVRFDPQNPSIAYAVIGTVTGGAANGFYKSTDAGETWTRSNGTGAAQLPLTQAGRLAFNIAPSAPNVIYLNIARGPGGTGPAVGTFRSADGGQNWTQLPAPDYCNPQCWYNNVITVHPRNPNVVFFGGLRIYRTGNGGASFADVTLGSDGNAVHVDHHAHAYSADGSKLYIGNDGGVWSTSGALSGDISWTNLNTNLAITQFYPGHSIDPNDPDLTYAGTQDNGFQRYTAGKWETVTCGDGGWGAVDPAVPSVTYATCQNIDIRKQTAQGNYRGWLPALQGISGINRGAFIPPFVMDPTRPTRLLFASHKLYESPDGGGHWTAISDDLTNSVSTIRSIAVSPVDPRIVWVGTQNGLVQVTSNSHETGQVQWTNRGQTLPRRIATQIAAHPVDSQTAYVSYAGFGGAANLPAGHVYKTTDLGENWEDVSSDLPNVPVNDLVIDPDAHDTLYAATDAGVYRSTDAGASWQPLGEGLPRVVVMGVKLHRRSRILRAGTHGRGMWDIHLPLAGPTRAPRIESLSPQTIAPQPGSFALTVRGENFASGASVRWNGSERPTTFVSPTEVRATISGADIRNPGRATVAVLVPANGGGLSNLVNFNVGGNPILSGNGVISPASGSPGLVSGSIMTIVGANLASDAVVTAQSTASFTLGGAMVEMDGSPVPITYASPNQIHFQVPWGYAPYRSARITASLDGARAPVSIDVPIVEFAPALFSVSGNGQGQGAVLILGTEGSIAAPAGAFPGSRPARTGETLEMYATGLGPVTRTPATGAPPLTGAPALTVPVTARLGGVEAPVVSSTLAPGLIGVYRVQVRVSDSAPRGAAVPVTIAIGEAISNAVTVAIE